MALTADFVTNKPTTFAALRYANFQGALQEGVVDSGDLMVVQRAAGANMSADVGAGGGWVQIDSGTRNGMAHVVNDAVANVTITTAHATLPRVDQIVLQYNDTAIPAGVGGDIPTLRVITGVATSGATLDNRTGAGALPADALRLADVLVAAAATTVLNTSIRDRRPFARGANYRITRTANASAGNDYALTTTLAEVDTTNLKPRIECSGVPLQVRVEGVMVLVATAAGQELGPGLFVDGALAATTGTVWSMAHAAGTIDFPLQVSFTITPTAGSHRIGLAGRYSAGTSGTFYARAANPLTFHIRELVAQDTANNLTTSG